MQKYWGRAGRVLKRSKFYDIYYWIFSKKKKKSYFFWSCVQFRNSKKDGKVGNNKVETNSRIEDIEVAHLIYRYDTFIIVYRVSVKRKDLL